jgi:hypothetical protein
VVLQVGATKNKTMKHHFPAIAVLAVCLMGSVLVPTLKADERNKKTTIRIDQSIDVQGTVLSPGSYVIKLLGSSSYRRIIQIFNADETQFIGTVMANPAYRFASTSDSQFTYYEALDGQLPSLRTWFYPGDNSGFEFRSGRSEVAARSAHKHTNATTSGTGGTSDRPLS